MTPQEEARQKQIEARVESYVHVAKRMILELFGAGADHDHIAVTVQLATAMVQLEAAYRIAETRESGARPGE